jgi:hypothetical protein
MRTHIPIANIIGLVASAIAVGFWTTEQLTGLMVFEILTIPVKLVVLAAPLFFLSDLSAFLHRRPRLAVRLGITQIVVTLCAMWLYLPWRSAFAAHFNNDFYRWYYEGMEVWTPNFVQWQVAWVNHVPHMIEAGIVLVYYTSTITACTAFRLSRVRGAIVAFVGYLLLCLIPMFTDLILWDYDIFLKGIAFDSISMDLFPLIFWYGGDQSIFLYTFMLIFFGVTARFFYVNPRNTY